jgi:hypothetical protein
MAKIIQRRVLLTIKASTNATPASSEKLFSTSSARFSRLQSSRITLATACTASVASKLVIWDIARFDVWTLQRPCRISSATASHCSVSSTQRNSVAGRNCSRLFTASELAHSDWITTLRRWGHAGYVRSIKSGVTPCAASSGGDASNQENSCKAV